MKGLFNRYRDSIAAAVLVWLVAACGLSSGMSQ